LDIHELIKRLKDLYKDLGRVPSRPEFLASGVPRTQLDNKMTYNELVIKAGFEPRICSRDKESIEVVPGAPNVLFIDIETSPIKAYTWGLWDQNIGLNQIIDDWFILSFSAKWLGDKKMYYADCRNQKDISNDKKILIVIHELLSKCDYICGHNMQKFDLKKIKTRFIKHGLKPIGDIKIIDTLKIAKKHFAFTSNKLEFIAKFLDCKHRKMTKRKFQGQELWNECLKKNKKAFIEMEKYNKLDVIVTEEVYHKLVPYEKSINFSMYYQKTVCTCGSSRFYRAGLAYSATSVKQRWNCSKCGKRFTDKFNLVSKKQVQGLLS
jgi:hypothetical protein